jgi:hypothetical protein
LPDYAIRRSASATASSEMPPAQAAGAARLDQPVRVREDEVGRLESKLGEGVCRMLEHAERKAVPLQRLSRAAAHVERRQVPGVRVQQRVARQDSEEGRHECVAGQAAEQHRVGLTEHLGGAERVPAAGLDEEAHHRAECGGLDALAGHVAHEHRDAAAVAHRPGAVDVAAGRLVGGRSVEQSRLVARQLGQ